MPTLTFEQEVRALELLEMIVRPDFSAEGDRRMYQALDEAMILFGYREPPRERPKKKRGRPAKKEK